jgi:multidrug efflux pump subunit AcrA (membrane-fusion protein)
LQAGRLRVVVFDLASDLDEIFGIVPELRGWQTLRRAGVRLATHPALHEQGIPAADNADQRLRQGISGGIERDEIGFAKALAGDDHRGALLEQGQIGDRSVADNERLAESAEKTAHMTVHIQLPDGSVYPHPGLTNLLDVQVDTTTDTVAVRAQVPNPEGLLIPGGVVGVIVEQGAPRPALMIPQSAVLLDQAGRYVLVVDEAKKVELRRVTTGTEQGRDVVVMDGLKEGELVIVGGIQKVHPGQVVTASAVPGN